jgi:hypothetical protein
LFDDQSAGLSGFFTSVIGVPVKGCYFAFSPAITTPFQLG